MKTLKIDFEYKNKIDLFETVITVFAATQLREDISKREKVVLREYIVNGYNEVSWNVIMTTLSIDKKHLNVIHSKLQKKGFLKPHHANWRMKVLNKDLLNLKNVFFDNEGKKVMLIDFKYVV